MRFALPTRFRTEAKANLALALPLIGAQIAAVGMGTIDTIYAGQLGSQSLAAVAVAVNINILFLVFFMGLLMACSPVVAQMVGAGRSSGDIGAFARLARRFALACGLTWMVLLNVLAAPVLTRLHLAADTTQLAIGFERWLSFSAFGLCLWYALRFSAEGMAEVRPIVIASTTGLAANALFGWLFVFGHFGLPQLGVRGLGLATTLASALMAATLWLQYHRRPVLRLLLVKPASKLIAKPGESLGEIFRIGLPIATIILAEAGLFVLAALMMARFGETVVAAYQIAINFASLMFMIPLGVSMATTVRVGHAAGAGDLHAARYRGFVGISFGGFNAASNAALMLLLPLTIAGLYTNDDGIRRQAAGFLLLAGAFQLFDGIQTTASGALRGLKDTRVPMFVTLFSYWIIGMPIAWWLAFHLQLGPAAIWWGLTAGLGMAAIGLLLRFTVKSGRSVRKAVAAMPIGS